jgi:hypothetical protein
MTSPFLGIGRTGVLARGLKACIVAAVADVLEEAARLEAGQL